MQIALSYQREWMITMTAAQQQKPLIFRFLTNKVAIFYPYHSLILVVIITRKLHFPMEIVKYIEREKHEKQHKSKNSFNGIYWFNVCRFAGSQPFDVILLSSLLICNVSKKLLPLLSFEFVLCVRYSRLISAQQRKYVISQVNERTGSWGEKSRKKYWDRSIRRCYMSLEGERAGESWTLIVHYKIRIRHLFWFENRKYTDAEIFSR